jgi:hypothetical protein
VAATADRAARTKPARDALMRKFEAEVDPDGVMTPEQRAQAAESARQAHYRRLALRSAEARKARKRT